MKMKKWVSIFAQTMDATKLSDHKERRSMLQPSNDSQSLTSFGWVWGMVAMVAIVCDPPTNVYAAAAIGDIGTGITRASGVGTTVTYFAHSFQSFPAVIGPNNVVAGIAPAAAPGILIRIGNNEYQPLMTVGPKPKPAPPDFESLTSTSGGVVGRAGRNTLNKEDLFALGRKAAGTTGTAAGAAFDPFPVSGIFTNYQETINATLAVDSSRDFSGLVFFAVDSRLFPNLNSFYQAGEPFDRALWSLTISANKPIISNSDLNVKFTVNPTARADGYFDPVNRIDCDSGSGGNTFCNAVQNAFTISNDGTASLSHFDLFPSGTIYVANNSGILYGDGVNAGVTAPVPEPSAWLLFVTGLAGFLAVGWRRQPKVA